MAIPASLDFYTRKLVYALLQLSLALAWATAWAFSAIAGLRKSRAAGVQSIAAVWYWPPDYPAASYTRLGIWKARFEDEGIRYDNFHVGTMAEFRSQYESGSWTMRYWFLLKLLWRRWAQLFRLRRYDVVWIDRWFYPHYPLRRALFERCIRRMVRHLVIDSSDGSDYAGNPALVLDVMSLADRITVAYKGLYDFYSPRFRHVERFEYPIIEDAYRIRTDHSTPERFTLGWMGSPTNFLYLKAIEGELQKVAKEVPFRLVVICRQREILDVPGADVMYHAYADDYYDLIARFDVGLAPFTTDDFSTTGKIAMKHQEFLLCAIPQVCSPVGISEHAIDGEHVLVAQRIEDWSAAILRLLRDRDLRNRLATRGRELCLKHYTPGGQWPAVRHALTLFSPERPRNPAGRSDQVRR